MLTYRTPANRTIDRTDPIATTGRYVFADTGDWGIVARPPTSHTITHGAPATGSTAIEAGTERVRIVVQPPEPPSEPSSMSSDQPGFGLLGAVLAILIASDVARDR